MAAAQELLLDDVGVLVRVHGEADAPAIVLVHGSGCDGSVWDSVAGRLADGGFRVVALDLPGHGRSAPRPGTETLQIYAEAVGDAIRGLGLHRAAVGGHSIGGAVALTLALALPDVVSELLLIGTGGRLRVVPAVIEALRNDFDGAMASLAQFAFGPGPQPAVVRTLDEMMRRNGQPALLADFLACDAFDVMGRLGEIPQRALAVCGDLDALTPPKYSRFLAERMPDCVVEIVPGAGHMLMLEAPEALATVVAAFLGKRAEGNTGEPLVQRAVPVISTALRAGPVAAPSRPCSARKT